MKTTSRLLLALAASFLFPLVPLTAADHTYYWNPTNATITSEMGGSGTWNSTVSNLVWWRESDGEQVSMGGNTGDSPKFGGSTTGSLGANLIFNGSGTIERMWATYFNSPTGQITTHTFTFNPGSSYIVTALDGGTGSARYFSTGSANAGGNAVFSFNLAPDASFSIQGTTGNFVGILAAHNLTGGNGVIVTGGGTMNFNNNSLLRFDGPNSRLLVTGGSTLNFNTGSAFTSTACGTIEDPFSSSINLSTRAEVNNATLNISGGNLNTGYRGTTAVEANGRVSSGIMIGNSTLGQGTVNLSGGTLKAIGDARSSGLAYSGIAFASIATNSGGSFNMTGGTLIVSNIRASTSVTNAAVNFNGGTLIVSTEKTTGDTTTTTAQLQTRLENFLAGFGSTATNHVALGTTGLTIDTSQIDTSLNGGIANINTSLTDMAGHNGSITKIGANTLLLSGFQAYTGNTTINAGSLAIGNLDRDDLSTNIARSARILIKNGAIFDTTRSAVVNGYKVGVATVEQVLANEGTGKVVGDINSNYGRILPTGTFTIEGNFTTTTNRGIIQINNLDTDLLNITGDLTLNNGITFDLSNASITAEDTYTLALAQTITYGSIIFTGADLFTFDITKGTQGALETLQITAHAIPEPSTTAALLGLTTLAFLLARRRK